MSADHFAPSVESSTSAIRVPLEPLPINLVHDRHPRRVENSRQFALAELAKWFVNCETQPHFIVEQGMTVLHMNAAAERFLVITKVMTVNAARFQFARPSHRAELARVLLGDAEQTSFRTRISNAVTSVSIRRLPLTSSKILLITASPACESDYQRVQFEFGLTKAEAEIAIDICKGLSLVKIAEKRTASINTVKTQARHIFHKCRVHSQVALTRRMSEFMWERPTAVTRTD